MSRTGLTAVTGLTVALDGSLYAAELATEMAEADPIFTDHHRRAGGF